MLQKWLDEGSTVEAGDSRTSLAGENVRRRLGPERDRINGSHIR